MTRTIQHAIAAGLAASALATAPAVAQSIDALPPGHAGQSAPYAYVPATQDLRGERARDAARAWFPATQDLRGERARDAARAWFPATQDLRGERARDAARMLVPRGQPTWPADPDLLSRPLTHAATSPADRGADDVWGIIGIGLAGAGLVAGGATGVARRLRVRGRRVAV
jgi:hypothetical protein